MEHLEYHPYAFLDKDNNVLQILNFEDHNIDLLNQVKNTFNFFNYISCCEFGYAVIGGTYDGLKFWPPQPYPSWIKNEETNKWEAPIPYPVVEEGSDEYYIWDENTTSWLLLPPSN